MRSSPSRFSPKGDRLAVSAGRTIVVVDLSGKTKSLLKDWGYIANVAWRPDGSEIWFGGQRRGGEVRRLRRHAFGPRANRPRGGRRSLLPRHLERRARALERLLLAFESRCDAGRRERRSVSFPGWTGPMPTPSRTTGGSSSSTSGERAGATASSIYLRATDGSAAVRLGEGYGSTFLPTGGGSCRIPRQSSETSSSCCRRGPGSQDGSNTRASRRFSRAGSCRTANGCCFSGVSEPERCGSTSRVSTAGNREPSLPKGWRLVPSRSLPMAAPAPRSGRTRRSRSIRSTAARHGRSPVRKPSKTHPLERRRRLALRLPNQGSAGPSLQGRRRDRAAGALEDDRARGPLGPGRHRQHRDDARPAELRLQLHADPHEPAGGGRAALNATEIQRDWGVRIQRRCTRSPGPPVPPTRRGGRAPGGDPAAGSCSCDR